MAVATHNPATAFDYLGRTVDLSAFTGQDPDHEELLTQSLGVGELITGPIKLAQRWMLELLTPRGSMPFLPGRGTPFIDQLHAGQLRTVLDVRQAFLLAVAQAENNLAAEEDETMPSDERIANSTLLSLSISGDAVTISVQLFSRAGTARIVVLPIAVNVTAEV